MLYFQTQQHKRDKNTFVINLRWTYDDKIDNFEYDFM